jgi:alpha-beta hydrolase superfamily lysophospholipase
MSEAQQKASGPTGIPFERQAGESLLKGLAWMPESGGIRAGLAIVHGQGEHVGRYGHLAEWMMAEGIAVFGLDHPGHGRSPGQRGHVRSLEAYLDTCRALQAEWEEREPGKPLFMLGQSMGGNILANYLLRDRATLAGAIFSSSWFTLAFKPPAFKVWLASKVQGIWPSFSEPNNLDAADLSRDPQVGQAYKEDPLVHDRITAGAFFSLHESGQWALDHADQLSCPALVLHGTADRLTAFSASKAFAEKAEAGQPGQVRFEAREGAYHELHNETDRSEILELERRWILDRLV